MQSLSEESWPWESIDDTFFINHWDDKEVRDGLAYKFRSIEFDRFVALDDFDVEKAAFLRESFRIPGMGQTTARHFRDKLAMRIKAAEAGINVPPFTSLFSDNKINEFKNNLN